MPQVTFFSHQLQDPRRGTEFDFPTNLLRQVVNCAPFLWHAKKIDKSSENNRVENVREKRRLTGLVKR